MHVTKCLSFRLCMYNVHHHLLWPHLIVWHQIIYSQPLYQEVSRVTVWARFWCCSVICCRFCFLGRSGFHLYTNRLWQLDLKSQIAEQSASALQQTLSSHHQGQVDMLEMTLQTSIG